MTCACLLTFTVSARLTCPHPRLAGRNPLVQGLHPVFGSWYDRDPSQPLNVRIRASGFGRAHSAEGFQRRGGPDERADAASSTEIEFRVRVLAAFNDRFAGERVQLVLSRPPFDPTDLAGDRLRQLGELEAADALVRCAVLPAVGEDRPRRLGIGGELL